MKDRLLLGLGSYMIPIPRMIWERVVKGEARKTRERLSFMSKDHHRVRDFAVLELPRTGAPLAPEAIAKALDLDVPRVISILDELEKRLTFVFRERPEEAVTWAYPMTVDETPHHATLQHSGQEAWSP